MRPGWAAALRMSASRLPHARLLDVDARMELAAARPVIVPDTIVIDGGKVFVSDTFIRACARLGVSVQDCRPGTPTDKGIVEATFDAINTLFCQHVAGYTGSNTQLRGDRVSAEAAWTVPDLQDLLDEWLLAGWQRRPHDALRDPYFPRKVLSPNDKYAALVAAAGYLPLTLTGEDYLELLPVALRAINDYGIRIDYRTYDAPELGPWRRQHSGNAATRGLWEVHYDPLSQSSDNGSYADLGIIPIFTFSGRRGLPEVGIMQAAVIRALVRGGCRGSRERCRWAGSVPAAVRSLRCGQEPVP
jgi:hypothetical protein